VKGERDDVKLASLSRRAGVTVEASPEGLRVRRTTPSTEGLASALIAFVGAGLLAAATEWTLLHLLWIPLMIAHTGFRAGFRGRAAAVAPIVARLRRTLEIRTTQGQGFREQAGRRVLVIDGDEVPLEDLKRVAVERLLTRVVREDGATSEVPREGCVVLVLRDRGVLVSQCDHDSAVALASEIARAAGVTYDWLADRVDRIQLIESPHRRPSDFTLQYWGTDLSAARDAAFASLSQGRQLAMAFVRLAAVLGLLLLQSVAFTSTLVEKPGTRWAVVGGVWLAWMILDAVVVQACRRIALVAVRDAARARLGIVAPG
jgi:hypothetical protein